MNEVAGIVGAHHLTWKSVPRGDRGRAYVVTQNGVSIEVSWRKDSEGIWIELPYGTFGFDIYGEMQDDGKVLFRVSQRSGSCQWSGVAFYRAGESSITQAGSGKKKGYRIKAQMPGKIIRILATPGARVTKGQSLLVMEAMKMENEIKAPEGGLVSKIPVTVGQAVDTGAELLNLDAV